jgi:hypothetical protein
MSPLSFVNRWRPHLLRNGSLWTSISPFLSIEKSLFAHEIAIEKRSACQVHLDRVGVGTI